MLAQTSLMLLRSGGRKQVVAALTDSDDAAVGVNVQASKIWPDSRANGTLRTVIIEFAHRYRASLLV